MYFKFFSLEFFSFSNSLPHAGTFPLMPVKGPFTVFSAKCALRLFSCSLYLVLVVSGWTVCFTGSDRATLSPPEQSGGRPAASSQDARAPVSNQSTSGCRSGLLSVDPGAAPDAGVAGSGTRRCVVMTSSSQQVKQGPLDEQRPGSQVDVCFCPETAKETEARSGAVASRGLRQGRAGVLGPRRCPAHSLTSSSEAVEIRVFCLLVIKTG